MWCVYVSVCVFVCVRAYTQLYWRWDLQDKVRWDLQDKVTER